MTEAAGSNRAARQRVPCEDKPADDEMTIHGRLQNWAAWCRSRPVRGRALSAEGRYIPEGIIGRVMAPTAAVDSLDAVEINAALLKIGRAQRLALELRYYAGTPDRVIARVVGVAARIYPRFMRVARLSVRNVSCTSQVRGVRSAATTCAQPTAPSTPPGTLPGSFSPESQAKST